MEKHKRGRMENAALNSITSFTYQIVHTISLFVIPRLILTRFGSDYNGITNSVTQFLGVVSLMSAGIGGVTSAALYKPLAEGDDASVSRILRATEFFLRKIAVIFCVFLLALASIYPLIIKGQFKWFFSFSLVIIIGLSTVAQYCFGMTYRYLFQSDQRMSVVNNINTVSTALNIIIAVVLIRAGFGIHIVKLGSAIAFSVTPFFLYVYAHKQYNIDKKVEPDNSAIKQRWDAFGHQVALFINSNTDTMLLTFITTLKDISVYSVYSQVTNGLYTILRCFFPSLDSTFGDMFVRNEKKTIKASFHQFELIVFSLSTVMFTTALCLLEPFIGLYTRGVTDTQYHQPVFGIILTIASYFFTIRVPYQNIIEAVGHYKQTKIFSYAEAIMNLLLSIILVFKFGLVGVAIGTLLANAFRTVCYAVYISNNLIEGVFGSFFKHLAVSICSGLIILFLYRLIPFQTAAGYGYWFIQALVVGVISCMVVLISDFLLYRNETASSIKRIKNLILNLNR